MLTNGEGEKNLPRFCRVLQAAVFPTSAGGSASSCSNIALCRPLSSQAPLFCWVALGPGLLLLFANWLVSFSRRCSWFVLLDFVVPVSCSCCVHAVVLSDAEVGHGDCMRCQGSRCCVHTHCRGGRCALRLRLVLCLWLQVAAGFDYCGRVHIYVC